MISYKPVHPLLHAIPYCEITEVWLNLCVYYYGHKKNITKMLANSSLLYLVEKDFVDKLKNLCQVWKAVNGSPPLDLQYV